MLLLKQVILYYVQFVAQPILDEPNPTEPKSLACGLCNGDLQAVFQDWFDKCTNRDSMDQLMNFIAIFTNVK